MVNASPDNTAFHSKAVRKPKRRRMCVTMVFMNIAPMADAQVMVPA